MGFVVGCNVGECVEICMLNGNRYINIIVATRRETRREKAQTIAGRQPFIFFGLLAVLRYWSSVVGESTLSGFPRL